MKYIARAYLCANSVGLMSQTETNSWDAVLGFVWEHCHSGLDVEITETETGNHCYAYAEDIHPETVDASELISYYRHSHKSELISIISRERKLEDFLDRYGVIGTIFATEKQLTEYIYSVMCGLEETK